MVDGDGVLVGIVTNRDMRFETDQHRLVRDVMTPMPLVTAPVGVDPDTALSLLSKHKIEKLPLVDDGGRLRGLITVKDFVKRDQYPHATKDADGRLVVGAALGVGEDAYKRAGLLVDAGVDVLVVDTAHGHQRAVLDMVARREAGLRWRQRHRGGRRQRRHPRRRAGAHRRRRRRREGRRRTRLHLHDPRGRRRRRPAGQRDLRGLARGRSRPVCRSSPTAACSTPATSRKALVAGADTVMIGGLFAGVEEAPGELVFMNGKQYKTYRGMGSLGAMQKRGNQSFSRDRYFADDVLSDDKLVPEGIEGQVPYRGRAVRRRPPARRRPARLHGLRGRGDDRRAARSAAS